MEERGRAGAKELRDWLRRCRAAMGKVKGSLFVLVVEYLVQSNDGITNTVIAGYEVIHFETTFSAFFFRC